MLTSLCLTLIAILVSNFIGKTGAHGAHRLNPSPWAEYILPVTNHYLWIHAKLRPLELSEIKKKKGVRGEEGSLKRSVNQLVNLLPETGHMLNLPFLYYTHAIK